MFFEKVNRIPRLKLNRFPPRICKGTCALFAILIAPLTFLTRQATYPKK